MVRYVTPAEYQRLLRQRQQEIDRHNRQVDAYNRDLQRRQEAQVRAINEHNRKVDNHNRKVLRQRKQAVDNYNHEVRSHNARVNAYRQQLTALYRSVSTTTVSAEYVPLRTSAFGLANAYEHLEQSVGQQASDHNDDLLLGLPGKETANSLRVVAALANGDASGVDIEALRGSPIVQRLKSISPDFGARWEGALFALHPQNPDGARHFCTSAREIVTGLLDLFAPDGEVLRAAPPPQLTERGTPTRRSKVYYLLRGQSAATKELSDFVAADVDNIVDLFNVFNGATHGSAGRYEWQALQAIKTRVEDGIVFLAGLAGR